MDRQLGDVVFVGQYQAERMIDTWSARNNFPHFMLIVGENGSGRKSLSYLIAKALGAQVYTISDVSVESCRNLIRVAYTVNSKIVYLIPDADNMSAAARNSLLKLTEEPPEFAYVIMTLNSLDNTLPTLRSRSQHIRIEPYSVDELKQLSNDDLMPQVAKTPGMLKLLESMGQNNVNSFISTCEKIVMYIDKVTTANALKSSNSIKFKESDKGYDLNLMIAGIEHVLQSKMSYPQFIMRLSCWYKVISKYRIQFNRAGVNKRAVYDQLIFDIRKSLRERGAI